VEYRRFGKTGRQVSAIGFGAWALGADWGTVDDNESLRALHAAADAGVTLFDTADVYGDGRSEQIIGRFLRERRDARIFVATKMGRRVSLDMANYTPESFRAWVDRSRENLGMDKLDLVQLHCLPTPIYYSPEHFAALDELVAAGAIASYGVSVEKVEEGLKAIEFPGLASVQIIFNMVRQRPAERFLAEAARRDVGVLARVPLASGLLTGKMSRQTSFEASDHRNYNRHGEAFDVGETFSGVDYETGLEFVEELRALVPGGATMAQTALRWILMFEGVTAAIPGAKSPDQARANAAAADLPPFSPETMAAVAELYKRLIKPLVHQRW
jgi:aryl-alcohol dehydrogenase-like predicted oxidoreductase